MWEARIRRVRTQKSANSEEWVNKVSAELEQKWSNKPANPTAESVLLEEAKYRLDQTTVHQRYYPDTDSAAQVVETESKGGGLATALLLVLDHLGKYDPFAEDLNLPSACTRNGEGVYGGEVDAWVRSGNKCNPGSCLLVMCDVSAESAISVRSAKALSPVV